jgi:hypothetical protein
MIKVSQLWWAGTGWDGKLIKRFDLTPWQGKLLRGRWTHTAMRFDFDLGVAWSDADRNAVEVAMLKAGVGMESKTLGLIYESNYGGVHVHSTSIIDKLYREKKISEHICIDLKVPIEKAWRIWRDCESIDGYGYDYLKLLAFFFWIRRVRARQLNGISASERPGWLFGNLEQYICSELTFDVLQPNGINVLGPYDSAQSTTPNSQFLVATGVPSIMYA